MLIQFDGAGGTAILRVAFQSHSLYMIVKGPYCVVFDSLVKFCPQFFTCRVTEDGNNNKYKNAVTSNNNSMPSAHGFMGKMVRQD